MDQTQLTWLTNFIWNIADDVLRDVYVRGKYRDVILPMTVLRRLDAVLEPTKQAVLEMKAALDREQITNQDDALRAASGQAFYNTSPFLLRDLKSRATQQKLRDDFEVYLDGFSPSVQDILTNFEFRNQIPRLSKADALGQLIEKFLDKEINISPNAVGDLPALDNHSMGTMFEELVRRFNEDNNEEAGEHWTPRDAVRLMANLMFLPVADKIESGTYLLYDCACGTGGMLTVAEETLQQIAKDHGKQVATHLYGQEINAETYAICKADLLLKGDGDAADNIVGGPEHSTLANDAFRSREFDFMLANPPYDELGDDLFEKWATTFPALEKLLADWSDPTDQTDPSDEDAAPKKALPEAKKKKLLNESTWRRDASLIETATKLRAALGDGLFVDHNFFLEKAGGALKRLGLKPAAADLKLMINAVSWHVEGAPPVIKKVHKPGKVHPDPLRGLFPVPMDGKVGVVEYEPDSELRDFEQIPLLEEGRIDAFIRREVLPYTPDAWLVEADTKIDFEVSFTRHFYQPPVLRTLAEISADILALEEETEGLLSEITGGVAG